MRTYHRILSVLTLVALMSGSALLAGAQDDREYDPQRDDQATLGYPAGSDDQPTQADPPARAAHSPSYGPKLGSHTAARFPKIA